MVTSNRILVLTASDMKKEALKHEGGKTNEWNKS